MTDITGTTYIRSLPRKVLAPCQAGWIANLPRSTSAGFVAGLKLILAESDALVVLALALAAVIGFWPL